MSTTCADTAALLEKGDALLQKGKSVINLKDAYSKGWRENIELRPSSYYDCLRCPSECACASECTSVSDKNTLFAFGSGDKEPKTETQNGTSLFTEAVPNPFSLTSVAGDGHTPYSAPLWFESDQSTESGYRGKSLPPFWWKSRFPGKSDPENPLGFQGHSILR